MEEVGEITKLTKNEKSAIVRFSRKSACDRCKMCVKNKDNKFVNCTVENVLKANVGDYVKVKMSAGYVLTASGVVYVLPVILIALALASTFMFQMWVQITALVASLLISGILIYVIDKGMKKKKGFCATMTEIIPKEKINIILNNDTIIKTTIQD